MQVRVGDSVGSGVGFAPPEADAGLRRLRDDALRRQNEAEPRP